MATHGNAFLAQYRIPNLVFGEKTIVFDSQRPIWLALANNNAREARLYAREALERQQVFDKEERAVLLLGLAAAEYLLGATGSAKRLAGRSLDLFPRQWAAQRILLQTIAANQEFMAGYLQLSAMEMGPVAIWDQPLTNAEKHLALSAWSWMLGEWDHVAAHLEQSFPDGVDSMPPPLQEDWFRLSLYRDRPEDAVAVASVLIGKRPVASADEILQTIVQNGWHSEALPLYRAAYKISPESELLRRRLVALCIKEGELEEARRLTQPKALRLAA